MTAIEHIIEYIEENDIQAFEDIPENEFLWFKRNTLIDRGIPVEEVDNLPEAEIEDVIIDEDEIRELF